VASIDGESLATRARERRNRRLQEEFPDLPSMSVVDLGGTVDYWVRSGIVAGHVVVVNRGGAAGTGSTTPTWIDVVEGDACGFRTRSSFDLVFSNSVIEHVGGFVRRREFAATVHELAPRHWVQTPNRYFPIEPHWGVPGMQFLPLRARLWIAARWAWGRRSVPPTGPERDAVGLECAMTELVGPTEMRLLFPGSELWRERVCGVAKSLVAVSGGARGLRPVS